MSQSSQIRQILSTLAQAYGPLHWWPAETPFEVIVGAFLTQNTSWKNVELALANLRSTNSLSVDGIRRLDLHELEQLIRPSGYFRQKASRLKGFIHFLDEGYGGSLDRMLGQPIEILRPELLELKGVGRETADAILLYAAAKPVFVVDVYARRVFERHAITASGTKYEDLRLIVQSAFHRVRDETSTFNELHALLVEVGKRHCGAVPKCSGCPLQQLLPAGGKPAGI